MIQINKAIKDIKGKTVLNEIDLELNEGKMYLLSGHNGCGKSMLLRLMCGLIKPTSGKVSFDKEYSFGVMIETPYFLENETALYNMKYLAAINKKIGINELNESLKKVNLYEKRNDKVKTYSLGMRQRLGICQAIMEDPEVLLLDEPFNALDEENYRGVFDILKQFRNAGKLIVIAAHAVDEVYKSEFDSIINMIDGKIVEKGN